MASDPAGEGASAAPLVRAGDQDVVEACFDNLFI
jgi:hypothetical protein